MAIDKIFNDANVDGIADNIFGAVNNSVSEVKAMQQRKAAENVQVVVEALKKIETNITAKFDNVTDVIEKRVLTIKDGRDGLSGSDGRNGRDGKPGRDGVNGKQGTPGTPGKDGVNGEDGVSVTNANIDFDGSLVISLSSGQQINVGEVVAPDLAEKIKIVSTMSTNGAVGIKDEGSSISTGVKNINFVGASVTATASGDDVTVNVSSGTGTVTSVAATVPAFLSVAGSPITTTGTLAISLSGTALPVANGGTGLTSGTSGGVLAYTASGTLASSAALAASALVIGGGAGAAPSTTTTGTGVVTALGVNTGTAGAFVVNGGALGTPSSGTVTNLTGTASININGTVGATTPAAGSFTTLGASSTATLNTLVSSGATLTGGTINGMTVGATTPATGAFTTLTTSSTVTINGGTANGVAYLNASKVLTSAATFIWTGATAQLGFQNAAANGYAYISNVGLGTNTDLAFLMGATEVGRFSSTGLAVTGTLSATGTITAGSTDGTITTGNGILNLVSTGGNDVVINVGASRQTIFKSNGTEVARLNASAAFVLAGGNTAAGGSGITFPAAQSASSDANTLDDYEEGTWTPSQGGNLTIVGTFSSSGSYTKIGRFVVARGVLIGSTSAAFTGGSPAILCANLPFTSAAAALGNAVDNNFNQGIVCVSSSTSVYGSSAITATASISFSVSFFV